MAGSLKDDHVTTVWVQKSHESLSKYFVDAETNYKPLTATTTKVFSKRIHSRTTISTQDQIQYSLNPNIRSVFDFDFVVNESSMYEIQENVVVKDRSKWRTIIDAYPAVNCDQLMIL